jgi:hypothetical protein
MIPGVDDMTLGFDGFQVILLFVSVLLVRPPPYKREKSRAILTDIQGQLPYRRRKISLA